MAGFVTSGEWRGGRRRSGGGCEREMGGLVTEGWEVAGAKVRERGQKVSGPARGAAPDWCNAPMHYSRIHTWQVLVLTVDVNILLSTSIFFSVNAPSHHHNSISALHSFDASSPDLTAELRPCTTQTRATFPLLFPRHREYHTFLLRLVRHTYDETPCSGALAGPTLFQLQHRRYMHVQRMTPR